MHDLMTDIDRRAELLEREHHDLDRPVDARAEATRPAEADGDRGFAAADGAIMKTPVERTKPDVGMGHI